MTIKGIFFDLDNTIWDFSASSKKALEAVYQKYLAGLGVDREAWLISYRIHNEALWQAYREGRESAENVKHLRFHHSFAQVGLEMRCSQSQGVATFFLEAIVKNTVLFPLVGETLLRLKEHYMLGVITNGFAASLDRLNALGLGGLFSVFVTAEEAGRPKPHQGIFIRAANLAGFLPHQVIYVGDDYESDVVGAKAAGMGTVLFNHKHMDLSAAGDPPDYIIQDFSQLIELLVPGAQ